VSESPEFIEYDEFGLFHENIDEYGLRVDEVPPVERVGVALPDGRTVSALRWGSDAPEIVFLHGGAQNAHTWDTVVLAMGRPALAVDLPGHGHSDWRPDGAYTPRDLADDVEVAITGVTSAPVAVVGMSLGGLAAMELAVRHPARCRSVAMVDITPGVNQEKTKAVIDFVDGPQSFDRFEDLLGRTIEFNPTRSVSSLRRGILHNARQEPDGSWRWRYDRSGHGRTRDDVIESVGGGDEPSAVPLWDDFGAVACPLLLVRGSTSPVVDEDDVAAARRRQPSIEVHVVDGAGHSVQGDRPVELAALLDDWLSRS
jgi:pimeloyl-ACP methyl ester carboxylesterase